MPDLIGLLLYSNARRLSVGVGSVEQAEFHSRSILGKDGEVDSLAIPCGSQWIGPSRPRSHFSSLRICLLVVKCNSLPAVCSLVTLGSPARSAYGISAPL